MAHLIERFMDHEVGLDTFGSEDQDVLVLSQIIEDQYSDKFDYSNDMYLNLYDYWKDCIEDAGSWSVCVYETDIRLFNAYSYDSANTFKAKNGCFTAAQFLDDFGFKPINIEETELMDLLR